MDLEFACPTCQQTSRVELSAGMETLSCRTPACAWSRPVRAPELAEGEVASCLVCGCDDLWRQKDFPQKLGLFFVGFAALLSTIFWAFYMPIAALSVLLFFAAVDVLLYLWMKDVLVCYRCAARYHGVKTIADYAKFNLETNERYRQEAARLSQQRQDHA